MRNGKLGVDVVSVISRCGGISDAATLIRLTSRRQLERATNRGLIVRDTRGRYALPTAEAGRRTANRLTALVSHTSAAAHWGWEMKVVPARASVTVPRKRKVPADVRADVDVFWRTFAAGPVSPAQVTPPLQTVIDCARWLPFDEALAIADSALRHRSVTHAQLSTAASGIRGRGAPAAARVLRAADGRADNPFESTLRAISLDVPGLVLVPQVEIRGTGRAVVRPDLVDESLRIVAEADSFEHHGSRRALAIDCARYDNLVAEGWTVLRFAWEQVMHRPDWVRGCLSAVTRRRQAAVDAVKRVERVERVERPAVPGAGAAALRPASKQANSPRRVERCA
jgi:very-short-patch-repair endonuclease